LFVCRYSLGAGALLGITIIIVTFRTPFIRGMEKLRRPVGWLGLAVVVPALVAGPYVLFFDPVNVVPRRAHVAREPRSMYLLFGDDVAYAAASRTWSRTVLNLFTPHNTHIVPAWRIVTWGLVRRAGSLERLPEVFAVACYAILMAVMLITGLLVARETGQTVLGLSAMTLVGTTSLMLVPVTWYSASQALWAGFGILATLWNAQSYRISGKARNLVFSCITAPLAGWFWTIGHMAGPAAAVYLWVDGRRRCRLAAAVPLAATMLAVVASLQLASRPIDATISFHGRSISGAIDPLQGFLHTAQAITENLVFGNLGLSAPTTASQAVIFTAGLLFLCTRRAWSRAFHPERLDASRPGAAGSPRAVSLFGPLECAGGAIVLGSYLVEWSFRGYLEFRFLRTINLHYIVPWYDAVPQIGLVLFLAGWWFRRMPLQAPELFPPKPTPASYLGVLAVLALSGALIVLNRPRVEGLIKSNVYPLLPSERERFPIERLQTYRANHLLDAHAAWQRAHLVRLDRAEKVARQLGLSRDNIRAALGHPWISGTVGRMRPELYDQYDAVALLDLPEHGRNANAAAVRDALWWYFGQEPQPRPPWIARNETWPPPAGANGNE
jgi:hypothetical protein